MRTAILLLGAWLLAAAGEAQQKPVESNGSIRYAERDGQRERRGGRDAGQRVDLGALRYGDMVDKLDGLEHVRLDDHDYFRRGDHYFEEVERDDRRHYVLTRPPVGARVQRLPRHSEVVTYAGRRYHFADDVYYEPVAEKGIYVVAEPPVGARIYHLPPHHQSVVYGERRFVVINGRCFRPAHHRGRLVYVRTPCPIQRPTHVTGTLAFEDRRGLPSLAAVAVRLVELGPDRDDVRRVIAEQVIRHAPRAPIPFNLHFDPGDVRERRRYAVEAEVRVAGRVLYVARRPRLVLTGGRPDHVDLVLRKP